MFGKAERGIEPCPGLSRGREVRHAVRRAAVRSQVRGPLQVFADIGVRKARRVGGGRRLAVIALVLASLALASAHRWSHQASDSCVTCAVARDLLPLQSAPAALPSPRVAVAEPVVRPELATDSGSRSATDARAPPRSAHQPSA